MNSVRAAKIVTVVGIVVLLAAVVGGCKDRGPRNGGSDF